MCAPGPAALPCVSRTYPPLTSTKSFLCADLWKCQWSWCCAATAAAAAGWRRWSPPSCVLFLSWSLKEASVELLSHLKRDTDRAPCSAALPSILTLPPVLWLCLQTTILFFAHMYNHNQWLLCWALLGQDFNKHNKGERQVCDTIMGEANYFVHCIFV